MDDLLGFDGPDANWKPLYRLSAFAALIAVLVFRRYLAAELSAFNGFGLFEMPEAIPISALDWFELLQHNPFVGLALLSVFDLVNYFLVGLIFLGLYAALKQVNQSLMGLATILVLVGIAVYFASNRRSACAISVSNMPRQRLRRSSPYTWQPQERCWR